MNLLLCKGCGCAYLHTHVSNGDFCQFCCRDIAAAPAAFKILKERNEEMRSPRQERGQAIAEKGIYGNDSEND